MGIKDIMDSFKKNPVDKLNTRDLQEEEIRLKNRMERIRKDINKIEKDKKQKFQEGVGADLMKKKMLVVALLILTAMVSLAQAAYHHEGEADSPKFVSAYPAAEGTKLDSCALCHCGG